MGPRWRFHRQWYCHLTPFSRPIPCFGQGQCCHSRPMLSLQHQIRRDHRGSCHHRRPYCSVIRFRRTPPIPQAIRRRPSTCPGVFAALRRRKLDFAFDFRFHFLACFRRCHWSRQLQIYSQVLLPNWSPLNRLFVPMNLLISVDQQKSRPLPNLIHPPGNPLHHLIDPCHLAAPCCPFPSFRRPRRTGAAHQPLNPQLLCSSAIPPDVRGPAVVVPFFPLQKPARQ